MAKRADSSADDDSGVKAEAVNQEDDGSQIEVPDGVDVAIYRDAARQARADKLSGATPAVNPFAAGTPQADHWDQGYAAGVPTPPSPPPPSRDMDG